MKIGFMNLGESCEKLENSFGRCEGAGRWDLYKIFVGGGENYGEFYINFNRENGTGEIVAKNPQYGKGIVLEIAKEMLPDHAILFQKTDVPIERDERFFDAVDRETAIARGK